MNRLLSLFKTKPTRFKRYKSFFHSYKDVMVICFATSNGQGLCQESHSIQLVIIFDVMVETLPAMVDKHIKEQVVKQVPEQEHENIQAQILTQIENAIANVIPSQVDASVQKQQYKLYLAMKADPQLQQQDIAIWLALQMKFERNTVPQTACRTPAIRPRYQDDPHDDAHPEGENSAKWQKTSEYEAYVSGDSSSGQTDSYASDDDEIPSKQVSQEIMEESGYKNLNKNDTEDIYLLIMNGKKVNLTTPTMTFPGIKDHEMFSIIYEPRHGIIYKNNVLRVYNNDVSMVYVQKDFTKDEKNIELFEEDIKERLKHRRQMRRWEMYVNRRPLGSRRERPE
ncbi:hypothetical protein Tco_1272971 [Tanacetum coccineum]